MSFLQHARIKTKIMVLILPICALGIAAAALISYNYRNADTAYSDFINKDAAAVTQMARATQRLAAMTSNLYAMIAYDITGADANDIKSTFEDNATTLLKRLETARGLAPAKAADIDNFIKKAQEITRLGRQSVDAALADRNEDATKSLQVVKPLIEDQVETLRAWVEAYSVEIGKGNDRLTNQTDNTNFYSLLMLAVSFAGLLTTTWWICLRGITGPIADLRVRMTAIAERKTETEVAGTWHARRSSCIYLE